MSLHTGPRPKRLRDLREAISAGRIPEATTKIRRGIGQLARGEGVPEDQLDAYLAKLKAQPE